MFVRIGVFDPLPLFQRGVMAVLLDAGLGGETPDDVLHWMDDGQQRLVVLTLHDAGDWELLALLCGNYPQVPVVALLPDHTVAEQVRALSAGAAATLPRDAPPATIRTVVESALDGRTTLSISVLRGLTSSNVEPLETTTTPSPRELDWLRRLSRGATVTDLADHVGYSERMMYRKLRELYARMKVAGRTEALLLAREHGWL